MSSFLKVNGKDVGSAVITGVIVAVLGYLGTLTDITSLDFKEVLNVIVFAMIASLSKSLGTNSDGEFLGAVKIK